MDNNPGISLFQSNSITIDNPLLNQEEDEDLEEQKRRQEEIQNFLTTAMDEFNYDDQSTINSSANVSVDDTYNNQSNMLEKYKNADLDDQLKVLYEVRVREVQELHEQLEKLKKEIDKQREINGKTNLLLEAEKDKTKISSQQAQKLLVGKAEEITKLKNEIESVRGTVLSLETTIKAVNDEYSLCKQSNRELIEQLSLMHNGLTTNTISDRQLQEQHHSEVSHLHHLLDSAHMKLHRKEKEFKELEQKLKDTANDKDMLMTEKCAIINQLSQNLENSLDRCQEFSQIIDKLSQENKTLKLSTTSELTDSIRSMGLVDKTEIVKALQKELDRAGETQEKQQHDLESLRETCDRLSKECKTYEISNDEYKNEVDAWRKKYITLEEDFMKSNEDLKKMMIQIEEQKKNTVTEYQVYENKIRLLQDALRNHENKENQDHSVQVSGFTASLDVEKDGNQKHKQQIDDLNNEIKVLNQNLSDAENRLSQMKITASLEKERENLIKTLQEKAAKFEEIIRQKQSKPRCQSVGINTESISNIEMSDKENILKTKFETDLVQKEIEIRTEVKQDFDLKLERMQKELSKKLHQLKEQNCENCKILLNNLKHAKVVTDFRDEEMDQLKERMKEDREAVATLLEEWSGKFMQVENEKAELLAECANSNERCDQLMLKLRTREAGDSKLYQVIKRECEETIKMWNENTLENLRKYIASQQERIKHSSEKIEEFSKSADMEVHSIEMQYLKKKKSLENTAHKRRLKYHT